MAHADGQLDGLLALWLRCGILTGLRPCEWQGAQFHEGGLVVINAKHTHGRACGETRSLDVSNLSPSEQADIRYLSNRLSEGDYAKTYAACRKRLAWVAKTLWPGREKRPNLYSARHQFSADAKRSGMSKKETA